MFLATRCLTSSEIRCVGPSSDSLRFIYSLIDLLTIIKKKYTDIHNHLYFATKDSKIENRKKKIEQESYAIAKMTAQCALHMGALKIFGTP